MDDKLLEAIKMKNNENVKKLLKQGANPNTVDGKGMPALAWARHNLEGAKILIDAGANTCGGYCSFTSPLSLAIRYANIPMIDLLVENGANFLLHEGMITAIEYERLTVIEHLIKLGADVNIPNSKSQLPITSAIHQKNWQIVQLLFERGADVNVVNSNGETFLIKFVRTMHMPIIKYLLQKKVDLDRKNNNNETALSVSLANDDFRTFNLLIEAGADPKLASQAIEAKIKANPIFADFMSKLKKSDSKTPRTVEKTDVEKAQPEEDHVKVLIAMFSRNTKFSDQDTAPSRSNFP